MTPAEFKTLREGMGLAAEEVGALLGVTRKTVFALESPSRALEVPEEHAAGMLAIVQRFHDGARRAVAMAYEGGDLPRFTDEAAFQEHYGMGRVKGVRRERKGHHVAEVDPLPLSIQGALLFTARSETGAGVRYAE